MENLMLPVMSPQIVGIDGSMIPFSLFQGNWNFYCGFWFGVLEEKKWFLHNFSRSWCASEKSLQFPEVVIDSTEV